MSYERLTAVPAPTPQPARISFYYPVESVFDDSSLRSMYQSRNYKDSAGGSMVDDFAITEDERDIHMGLMEDAVYDVFLNLLKYTKAIENSIAHNEPYINNAGIGVSAVKQKETVTLSGHDGYAYITIQTLEAKIFTFDTDLTITAANFVTSNAAYYLANGIVLTSSVADLIFESAVAGVPFGAPYVQMQQLSSNGTTLHTTANVVGVNPTAVNCSWVVIVDRTGFNENYLKAVDANILKAVRFYILRDWFSTQGKDADAKKFEDLYMLALRNMKNYAFQLKKVKLT